MNDDRRIASIVQRVRAILAVTAASYGLPSPSSRARPAGHRDVRHLAAGRAAAAAPERMREVVALHD